MFSFFIFVFAAVSPFLWKYMVTLSNVTHENEYFKITVVYFAYFHSVMSYGIM